MVRGLLAVGSELNFQNFTGAFLFGFEYYVEIEGPLVCGRWIHAKKLVKAMASTDHCQTFSMREVVGQPLAAKAQGRQAR